MIVFTKMKINDTPSFIETARSQITQRSDLFKPLKVWAFSTDPPLPGKDTVRQPDAVLELEWQEKRCRFLVEIKARTAPSVVKEGIRRLKQFSIGRPGEQPMILVPYLSKRVVEILEEEQISGIDLNGNYYIPLPDFLAVRLDRINRYPESREIKNIFSGNSSTVARFLLLQNRTYTQVNEIFGGIKKLGGGISLSTVSKVLQGLQDELMIEKGGETIRVLQPGKMLDALRDNYRTPNVSRTVRLKLPDSRQEKETLLIEILGVENWIWSGPSSAERYVSTVPLRILDAYTRADTPRIDELMKWENTRFFNCTLKQSRQAFIYFDCQDFWSSPLETYLALSQLDKREQELAQEIGTEILNRFSP